MNKKPKAKSHRPNDETAALQGQIQAFTEALQRERADAENLRRQHSQQLEGLRESTKANVVRELLPTIDNFERALKHIPKDLAGHTYVKGISSIAKQFEDTLKNLGVSRIKTTGTAFNPHYHNAISSEGEGQKEIVSEELIAGYKIGDSVIRPATVRVESTN